MKHIKQMYDKVEDLLFDHIGKYTDSSGFVTPAIGVAPEYRQAEVRGLEVILHPPTINKDFRYSTLSTLSYTWLIELYQHDGQSNVQEAVNILVESLGDRVEALPLFDHRYLPGVRAYQVKILFEILNCAAC